MVPACRLSPLARIRNLLCILWLVFAVFSEGYSAFAIALDRFEPNWFRIVGWLLLVLPCVLAIGLLLLYANLKRVGFYLCAMSLSFYVLIIFFDVIREHAERADWIFASIWLAFCTIGIYAAKLLMGRQVPS